MNPNVERVLKEVFGLNSFGIANSGRGYLEMSEGELIKALEGCIEIPSKIDKLLVWRYTTQGHAFWSDYDREDYEGLEKGREILYKAIIMLLPKQDVESYL